MLPEEFQTTFKALYKMVLFGLLSLLPAHDPFMLLSFVLRIATEPRQHFAAFRKQGVDDLSPHRPPSMIAAAITRQVTHAPPLARILREKRPMPKERGSLWAHRRWVHDELCVQIHKAPSALVVGLGQGQVHPRPLFPRRFRRTYRGRINRRINPANLPPRHRHEIGNDRLEPFAPGLPFAVRPRLQQVAERDQISTTAAAGLVAPPNLRRVIRLDCQRSIPRLFRSSAMEKTASANLVGGLGNLGQSHTVITGNLLNGHLTHQRIDVYEALFLDWHATENESG